MYCIFSFCILSLKRLWQIGWEKNPESMRKLIKILMKKKKIILVSLLFHEICIIMLMMALKFWVGNFSLSFSYSPLKASAYKCCWFFLSDNMKSFLNYSYLACSNFLLSELWRERVRKLVKQVWETNTDT